ncbi:CHASE3 domain-containing protein [Aurantimonas sp. A2-1-M11]|uniref:sensor histidine kinase n=1 Tax=Aurantimonas sp. A2-1-M11 TaxID=3113712 RepID=UPI002F9390B9
MHDGPDAGPIVPSLPVAGLLAGLTGLLLLAVTGMALWLNWQTTDGASALRRSAAVQASALSFLSRLQDAETGQRGYLLTGDAQYLKPYEQAVTMLPDDLAKLEETVRHDLEQQGRVATLKILLPRKMRELAFTVNLVSENRRGDAMAVVSAASGNAVMDDIRRVVTRILQSDDKQLIERETEQGRSNRLFAVIVAATSLAALLMLGLNFLLVRRQIDAAERLRANLADLNANLEEEVEKRIRESEIAAREAIGEKERAEFERSRVELLLQDVSHRIGNNLAMVSGMLGLQVASTSDEAVRSQLRAAQTRVATIANAQRRLRLSSDLSTVRADETIENTVADLRATIGTERNLHIETRLAPLLVESRDAVHLAILVNELATNAIKHAFVGRDEGRILVRLVRDDSGLAVLTVEDDGSGMPENIGRGGLGRKLVVSLARGFGGTPDIEMRPEGGTRVKIQLPDLELKKQS